MLDSWGAAVVAGAGSVTTLVLASRLLPLASIRTDDAALALAAWVAAAVVSAVTVRLAVRHLTPGALGAATGWIAGTLLTSSVLGWHLCPNRGEFEESGPVLAVWLAAGVLATTVRIAPAPALGWWAVPARVVITWASTYAGVWLFIAVMLAPVTRSVPDEARAAGALLGLAGLVAVFASACAWVGPSEPRAQVLASWLAQPLVVFTGPGAADQLRRAWRDGAWPDDDMEPLLAVGGVLSVLSLAGSLSAAALVVLRARKAERDAASDGPAR